MDLDGDGDLAEAVPLDLAGKVRRADDPAALDEGPGGTVVDRGALERLAGLPTERFTDLGGGSPAGPWGTPLLTLAGTLCPGHPFALEVRFARPTSPPLLWFSVASSPLPFHGATLHALPVAADVFAFTDGGGSVAAQTP